MELLSQILEEVGGAHLRNNKGAAARLCVCQKWYAAARPIYLSGLGTTRIKLFGHNIGELDTKYGYSQLRPLMHKNTRNLRIRLLGHWWDQNSSQAWIEEEEASEQEDNEDAAAGPLTPLNEPPIDFELPENVRALQVWRDEQLCPRLDALFQDLSNFEALEELTFEASADPEVGHERGPHWDYIYNYAALHFLNHLPIAHDLRQLTLDICGMRNGLLDGKDIHICAALSNILPRITDVRLRLPTLCRTIFDIGNLQLEPQQVKLKALIIKLQLPTFLHTDEARVQPCPQMPGARTGQALAQALARNSSVYLQHLARLRQSDSHGVTGFRISFAFPRVPSVSTLDCLTMKLQTLPEEYYLYEDAGKPNWYELNEAHRMLNGGDFRYNDRV